ncbi:acyl-CoA carboxylase subunit epsilon [Streptomyces flaveus]|uniref:acyl-CoA carboxylase subunit epsilon n=1 Tax=Streptomyces flaveus TaxID=66370 RepID=UPI00332CA3A2
MSSIHVLYGQPTPEEIAAVMAVFAARAGGSPPADTRPRLPRRTPRSAWADRTAGLRRPLSTRFTRPRSVVARGLP